MPLSPSSALVTCETPSSVGSMTTTLVLAETLLAKACQPDTRGSTNSTESN